MKFCVECGAPRASESAKFCGECGTSFGVAAPSAAGSLSAEELHAASLEADNRGDLVTALHNPSCSADRQMDSGRTFLFAIQRYTFRHGRCDLHFTTNEITADAGAAGVYEMGSISDGGDAVDFFVLNAAGVVEPPEADEKVSGHAEYLVWIGRCAPHWWSDTSIITEFLGDDVVAALELGDPWLFEDNMFPAIEQLLRKPYTGKAEQWSRAATDLSVVFSPTSESELLADISQRWMSTDNSDSTMLKVRESIYVGLARNPHTPQAVLLDIATGSLFDDPDALDTLRWLISRNSGAHPETRALMTSLTSDPESFVSLDEEVPQETLLDVATFGVHVAALARSWSADEFRRCFPDLPRIHDSADRSITAQPLVSYSTLDGEGAHMHEALAEYLEDAFGVVIGSGYDNSIGAVTRFEYLG